MATDGDYIYLHNSYGLMKIGTGCGGTVRGRVYIRKADWNTKHSGSLTCVGDRLYFRSASIAPASVIIVGRSELQVFYFLFSYLIGIYFDVNYQKS